jgi:AraC family transcriptional regulator
MSDNLVKPNQLPNWIPGKVTFDSEKCDWKGMTVRGYRYSEMSVDIPTMRDYLFVIYKGNAATMSRCCGGPWKDYRVGPGIVSILTRAQESQWRWDKPIDVSHLYLSRDSIASVAGEVFDRDIRDIELSDRVKAEDTVLPSLLKNLENEAASEALGGELYVEALKNQACIHILRQYSNVIFREVSHGGFSPVQKRLLRELIEENIDLNITLAELAAAVQLSVFHFCRKFEKEFGCPPHAFIIKKRVEQATQLLSNTLLPIKVIAAQCGFSDQSHMTRLFRRFVGVPPAVFRKEMTR